MAEFTKDLLRVTTGMVAVFPQWNKEESLVVTKWMPKFNGCFAVNNSTVCIVDRNKVFVAPYTRKLLRDLQHEGFSQKEFHVPFSNGDYPKGMEAIWGAMRLKAKQAEIEDFKMDCLEYSNKHQIGELDAETLLNCFEIPAKGVRVKRLYFENWYFPILDNTISLDQERSRKLGRFCANNGKVVFVYCDGKTYVAKGYKIIDELHKAGYTDTGMFVPFSNGEEILDPVLKSRWDSLVKF